MAILKLQQQNVAVASAFTEVAIVIPAGLGGRINELTIASRNLAATLYWYVATPPIQGTLLGKIKAIFSQGMFILN